MSRIEECVGCDGCDEGVCKGCDGCGEGVCVGCDEEECVGGEDCDAAKGLISSCCFFGALLFGKPGSDMFSEQKTCRKVM